MAAEPRPATTYRYPRAAAVAVFGVSAVVVALVWLGYVVARLAGVEPPQWVTVVLAVVTLGPLAVLAFGVARPRRVLTLSDQGYRLHVRGRAVGVRRAGWREVTAVEIQPAEGGDQVVVWRLADERMTRLPVELLGGRASEVMRDIHRRSDAAYGYRPLDSP